MNVHRIYINLNAIREMEIKLSKISLNFRVRSVLNIAAFIGIIYCYSVITLTIAVMRAMDL